MIIDIACVVILLYAIFKGFTKGLVVAVFSFLAVFIGLAAALKLSAVVAGWLEQSTHVSGKWLPFLSFLIVMIGVALLIRWCAKLIEAAMSVAMMGWINRLGGILFYLLLYGIVFSVILFFVVKMGVIKQETLTDSVCYPVLQPLGPWVIDGFGKVIPIFKDMFAELEAFFGKIATSKS
ncbi:MAG: CvpA family protein [Filimonas sp.]|nr:CvpA family protein [Filimonas sp.]